MLVARQLTVLAFHDAGRVPPLRWEFAEQQPGPLEQFLAVGMCNERVVQLLVNPSGNATAGTRAWGT
jgi:DNA gyrase subunit A